MPRSARVVQLQATGAGERLDRYLAEALPELSRSRLQQLIRAGQVTLDGRPARPSSPVADGMQIVVHIPSAAPPPAPVPQAMRLDVVYEDTDLLVIAKPAGLVVHPAAGHAVGTLVNALLAGYPDLTAGDAGRPGIVHRLDRDTSGLLVIARTEAALEHLRDQFKRRLIQKTYLALVHGQPPAPEGRIDAPVGRDPRQRKRMAVLTGGRPARTGYRVLAVLGDFSLLAVTPETGRTHQIRVHLAWLGVPVVGDRVYGRRRQSPDSPRQFLHAWRLSLERPGGGGRLDLECPLPEDLRKVLTGIAGADRCLSPDVQALLDRR
jgi:23S rRNA pseudouridine1911/1915/1917 synthase